MLSRLVAARRSPDDPAEAIPPYSERPDEIRARFRL